MSSLRLLRIWLLALVVVLVGCGGHDDDPIFGDLDASGDRKSDVASDRANDAGRDAPVSDVRVDVPTTPDARVDGVVDVRVDLPPVADVRVDPRIDAVVDVRVDAVPDVRVDVADARVDVRVDAVTDVARDTSGPNPDVDAGCGSDTQCGPLTPHCNTNTGACVARVAIAVTPANQSIAAGTTRQFTATMTYSDTSTGNVTALATWASSNTAAATVDPGTPGLATGLTPGVSTISASFAGLAGGTQLTVTTALLVSIQVTPPNASNALGTTRQFTATGTYSDNSIQDLTATATWASSATNVATIAPGGLASTLAAGMTTISATVATISGSATLTVTPAVLISINVTPANVTIGTLTTQTFTAIGTYTNNTTQDVTNDATWASSDPSVAPLNGTTATGLTAGTTNISATVGIIVGSTPLHVTGATLVSIEVTPANPTAPVGFNVQFTATGHFTDGTNNTTQDLTPDVLWGSSSDTNASISNAGGSEGLATALQQGSSTISATIAGITGSTLLTVTTSPLVSIEVTPATASIALGTTQTFGAIAHFMDGSSLVVTPQVSWSSSALGVATVSNASGTKGVATSVSAGSAIITASLNGASGNAMLTVTPATLLSIAITPANPSTALATAVPFTAMGTYSDATTQDITTSVTWNSGDQNVATISNAPGSEGLATPALTGTTTITATLNAIVASTLLTVTP